MTGLDGGLDGPRRARELGVVLVTGAGGRLGRRVLAAVARRYPSRVIATARAAGSVDGTPLVPLDLADHDAIGAVIDRERPDTVLHLGGVMGAAAERDPLTAIAVNAGSTRAILRALAGHPSSRLVLASTGAVYGDARAGSLDEAAELAGTSAYARTKALAEAALAEQEVDAVALRIANVYGPGFDDSLVNRLLRSSNDEPVPLREPDRFVRDYVHADDVAAAMIAAAEVELSESPLVVNIGTGRPVSSRQLLEIVRAHRSVAIVETAGAATSSVLASDRARSLLGFDPRCLEQGIEQL